MATSGQWSGQWLGGWQGTTGEPSGGSVVAAALHAAGQGSVLVTARAVVAAGLSVSGLGAVDATARTQLRAGLVAGGVGGFQGTAGEAAPVEPPVGPGVLGLSPLRIALQGFAAPFPLSALALAVQGFLGVAPQDVPSAEQPRGAIVGRGPGTTINLSAYLAGLKRRQVLPTVHTPAHLARKRAAQRRQRQLLAAATLPDF